MKIISFGWTAPALIAGKKTVTRRDWKDSHAAKFKAGEIVQAYDKAPYAGGKLIGYVEIVSVTKEPMLNMPESDYYKEGFYFLNQNPDLIPASMPIDVSLAGFNNWRLSGGKKWVIRFRIADIQSLTALHREKRNPSQGGKNYE